MGIGVEGVTAAAAAAPLLMGVAEETAVAGPAVGK